MGRIIYLCNADNTPTGGIKVIYRHAELLTGLGADAYVMHPDDLEFSCTWFEHHTRLLRSRALDPETDFLIIPEIYADARGFFCCTSDTSIVPAAAFSRYCNARSAYGVTRGMHLTSGGGEAKLVRCTAGSIYDVTVDLRPGSATYLNWIAWQLDGHTQTSLYIPAGCAHGYQVTTGPAEVAYKIDGPHQPDAELAIACDDPELEISWPLSLAFRSEQDLNAPPLADVVSRL